MISVLLSEVEYELSVTETEHETKDPEAGCAMLHELDVVADVAWLFA
jgi:hypothetical protein